MPFDYLIKPPCSSAKEIKDANNNVIGYTNEGCPAIILNNNKVICSNGDIYDPITDKDYNDPFVGTLTNRFNTINFSIGQVVYVENILQSLRYIFDTPTVEKFLQWNNKLLDELLLLSRGCGGSSKTKLKGRIVAITEDIFGDGRILWTPAPLYRNKANYPDKWPTEIFWLELFNGDDVGLENFKIGRKIANPVYYQEEDSSNNWVNKFNVGEDVLNFNGRQLYPVLREQITNLQTRMLVQGTNAINRSQIMNTPRFRSRGSCTTGSLCLDTTLTPGFKNSTKNMYLAPIPYAQRLGNTFRSSQIRGTKKIVRKNCVDPQFGRLVGTGGTRLVNKF